MDERQNLADLLDLQAVDSDIDRLLEQRQGLPELEQYRRAHDQALALAGEIEELEQRQHDLDLAIDKEEGEMGLKEAKKTTEERRMYAGGLSARDLTHLQEEVEMLGRNIAEMEDRILALLEDREQLGAELAEAGKRHRDVRAEEERLEAVIADTWKDIDAELARKEERKGAVVSLIPADLLELYELLRPHKEGVAVGRLAEGVCGGCHLRLSAAEQAQVLKAHPPRCLHCRRILVPQ